LKQADLQREYRCSRIDLREALNRLVEKGLVSLEPNRGYRVQKVDETRLLHLLQVRAVLEVEAIESIVTNTEQTALVELRSLAAAFSEAVMNGTVLEQERTNREFHDAFLRGCSNPELVWLINDLRNRTPVAQNRRKNTHAWLLQTADDHVEMISLLEPRDVRALRALMRRHVLGGTDALKRRAEPQPGVE
jgi:DNA-binding GntR family transcriptional regulator